MSLQQSSDNGISWKRRAVNHRNHFDEYSALTTVAQPGMIGLLWETCDAGGRPVDGCIKKDGSHNKTTFDPEATSINFVKMSTRFPGEDGAGAEIDAEGADDAMPLATRSQAVKTDDYESGGARSSRAAKTDETITVACTNETDCPAELQAALHNVAAGHVIVPHSRGQRPWYTRPLLINRSNLVLTLHPGVVIQAVRGAFHSGVLLKASGAHNLTIRGEGAALRMWRSDYANVSLYKHSEYRMGLSFYYCHNVTVSGLEIAETGGDGVYIEGIIGGDFRNITTDGRQRILRLHRLSFHNDPASCHLLSLPDSELLTCSGAYRNGMSVIHAVDLLVQNCTFRNTGGRGKYNGGDRLTAKSGGTAPRAGVDVSLLSFIFHAVFCRSLAIYQPLSLS